MGYLELQGNIQGLGCAMICGEGIQLKRKKCLLLMVVWEGTLEMEVLVRPECVWLLMMSDRRMVQFGVMHLEGFMGRDLFENGNEFG
ncbi:hypothetical protein Tco_1117319 [Tanacetum coccineum]